MGRQEDGHARRREGGLMGRLGQASAYERVLPILPGRYLGVGLKMASDSKPVGVISLKKLE